MSTHIDEIGSYHFQKGRHTKSLWRGKQQQILPDLSDLVVVLANSEELLEKSYTLRYQVYCLENNFEPASAFPNRMETDERDAQSIHALLVEQNTNSVLGTVRMIMPALHGSALELPISQVCAPDALTNTFQNIPYHLTAEVSRFSISKDVRKKLAKSYNVDDSLISMGEAYPCSSLSNYISLKLVRALIEMAGANGITHLCAVMTPSLLRMLRYLGIYFENIGPVVDYHGRRQPCYFNIETMLAGALADRPDVWAVLTDNGRLAKESVPKMAYVDAG